MSFSESLSLVVDYAWGLPLLLLLVVGGLLLMLYSRLLPLTGFKHSLRLISGRFHHEGDDKDLGQISHFQALTNALAGTIGIGNIGGVAVAVTQGGPGAIFWMWLTGLIGMNTKFFECSLSVMYRGEDYLGQVQGGPMYVIEKALPKVFRPMAYFFAVSGLVGTLALFQVHQLSEFAFEHFDVPKRLVGILSFIFVYIVALGGVKRIAGATSRLVPFMSVFYVLACLYIILFNLEKVPEVFVTIFRQAFSRDAAWGGALGVGFMQVMQIGVKRAAFSNEAGMGTAPMAHSNVKTSEPMSEGFVAMLGPLLDTLVICTMTALVILIAIPQEQMAVEVSGVLLTAQAFESYIPGWGKYFLGVAMLLFASTTMVGMANYNEKCWNFLFKGRWFLTRKVFIIVFCTTLYLGAEGEITDVVNFLDIGFAFMALPNMITTLILAPKVMEQFRLYKKKYQI